MLSLSPFLLLIVTIMARTVEKGGQVANDDESKGMRLRRRWVRLTPERLARREFERLVMDAIAALPRDIKRYIENVDIVVEEEPSAETLAEAGLPPGETLYGYYQGVPHQQRGTSYTMALPDKITIYRRPIVDSCRNRGQMRWLVRSTVIHELAHHFGIDDEELKRLGWE
jgi:predicted Zn-dependent protease with MMP-like domain